MKYLINFIITISFFFYLFQIKFIFLPFSTNKILALLGMFLIGFEFLSKLFSNKKIIINYSIFIYILSLLPIYFISFFSTLFNNETPDFSWITTITAPILFIIAYKPIYYLLKISNQNNFFGIYKYYLIVTILQLIIMVSMFTNNSIFTFFTSIQKLSSRDIETLSIVFDHRFIGFGLNYFAAGMYYSFIITIIISKLIFQKDLSISYKSLILNSLLILIIFLIGILSSRTTLFGISILIFALIIPVKGRIINRTKIRLLTIFLLIFTVTFSIVYSSMNENTIRLFKWGFELFVNAANGKGFNTTSSSKTLAMIHFSDEPQSLLLGDSVFITKYGYYKKTDVGYCRIIYYFGLLGLFFFLLSEYTIFSLAKHKNPQFGILFNLAFLLLLLCNIKGFASFSLYILPFCFVSKKTQNLK